MNSLRDIVESSPQLRGLATNVMHTMRGEELAQPLAPPLWDWQGIRKVLLVRLRSIGDTVLATPSLFALNRFLPHAEIDILLEDWVAPVLTQLDCVNDVITLERASVVSRARVARQRLGEGRRLHDVPVRVEHACAGRRSRALAAAPSPTGTRPLRAATTAPARDTPHRRRRPAGRCGRRDARH